MLRGESKQDPFPIPPPEAILDIACVVSRSTERRKQRRKREFYHFTQLPPQLRRMIYTNTLTLNKLRRYLYKHFAYEPILPIPHRPISHLPTNLPRSKNQIFFRQNLIVTWTSSQISSLARQTLDITHLLCKLRCVLRNDFGSWGILKVLVKCTNPLLSSCFDQGERI